MNSSLLSALDKAEKNPTCGYTVGLFSSRAVNSYQVTPDSSDPQVSDSTTVVIADDSSSSQSPIKSTPETSPHKRDNKFVKSPLCPISQYHSSQSSLESQPGSEITLTVDECTTVDSSSAEEASPVKGRTPHQLKENGGSPRGRGKGRGRGRGTGRGRGRGREREQGNPGLELKEKKLKGNAIGSNLVGIVHSSAPSKNLHSMITKNTTLFKGRQWMYTSPLERVSTQAPSSMPSAGQEGGVSGNAPDSTIEIPAEVGGNSPKFTPQNVTCSANRGGDEESSDVDSMASSSSASSYKFISSSTLPNKVSRQSTNSLETCSDDIQKFNSYQQDKEQTVNNLTKTLSCSNKETLKNSSEKSRRGRGRGRGSVKTASDSKTNSGTKCGLSSASKQSLAALEKNGLIGKTVRQQYSRLPDNVSSEASSPLIQAETIETMPKVQLTEVDSTINVPSDDESKKPSELSQLEKQEREDDTVDLITDKTENSVSEKIANIEVLCPGCGIWSKNLKSCSRCKRDFAKCKPTKFKGSSTTGEVKSCSKCGKLFDCPRIKDCNVNNVGQTAGQVFTCKACEDTKAKAVFGTKEFYEQKLDEFRRKEQSSNANSSANKTFGTKEFFGKNVGAKNQTFLKTFNLRSNGKRAATTVSLPNKRNKGRTKNAEPECISLLDSDDDEEATGSEKSQKPAEMSNSLNCPKESRKNRMRDETGNQVTSSTPNGTMVAFAVTPQVVKPGTPTVTVTNPALKQSTQIYKIIPGCASNKEFPGVAWHEESKTVTFDLVLLSFGSKRFMGNPPRISMSPAEIKFHFTTVEHGCPPVTLKFNEIEQLHYGLCKTLPAVFIESTPAFALMAKSRMNMKKPTEHFDPHSKETYEKYLFFRPHDACFTPDLSDKMKNIVMIMCQNKPKTKVIKELKSTDVNMFLGQCTPPETMARCQNQQPTGQRRFLGSPITLQSKTASTSAPVTPSTQRTNAVIPPIVVQSATHVNIQSSSNSSIILVPVQAIKQRDPAVRLITFPPPPAIGGVTVTSEDMECLQDGEFLNDVIIEFYLKYLLEEKLSAQDRERTHIFSSFFYKRLTQREYGGNSTGSPQETQLSRKEKRHQKVSKWTRKVDLFKKDFIIIPINESSHWYVAFICFPSRVQNKSTIAAVSPAPSSSPSLPEKPNGEADASKEDGEPMDVSESKDDTSLQSGTWEEEESKMEVDEPGNEETKNQQTNSDEQATSSCANTSYTSVKVTASEESSSKEGGEGDKSNKGETSSHSAIPEDATMEDAAKDNDDDDDAMYNLIHRVKREMPCILIMDSLKTSSKAHVMQKLREYLEVEWQTRKNTKCIFTTQNMKGAQLDVPQQSNFSDCGIFVLQYVEQFFKKPIRNFTTPIKGLRNWFPQSEVKAKRSAITQLIIDLKEKQSTSKAADT